MEKATDTLQAPASILNQIWETTASLVASTSTGVEELGTSLTGMVMVGAEQ